MTEYPPSSAAINALPEPVRRWIHELEAQADPAGTLREAAVQRENAAALAARVHELTTRLRELTAELQRRRAKADDDCESPPVIELLDELLTFVGPASTQPNPTQP